MILVTGGMGFIGMHLVRSLLDAGEDVVVTYHTSYRVPELWQDQVGRRVVVEQVDVTDPTRLSDVVAQHQVQRIVHLAMPGVAGLTPAEDYRVSMLGLLNVLEAARANQVQRITFASSSMVYTGLRAGPYREDATLPVDSRNGTEAFKKACEILLFHYADRTGLDVNAIRTRTVYGPLYYSLVNPPSKLCHAAAHATAVDFGPAGAPYEDDTADLSYVRDVAEVFKRAALVPRSPHRIYNVSQGYAVTYRELVDAVREVEPSLQVELKPGANPRGNPPDNYLATERIRSALDYAPQWGHQRAVADYVNWLRTHPL